MTKGFKQNVEEALWLDYGKTIKEAETIELYNAVSKAAMAVVGRDFGEKAKKAEGKKACYLSAEFLIGRMVYNNLLSLGLFNQFTELMTENGVDFRILEEIEDAALGNGGLGRLAACFLDSGATNGITLNGYGIRYKYGLFKQYFEDGFQKEMPDDWTRMGDPWSERREDDAVVVEFKGQSVRAVPYDSPVIGYGGKKINLLRLWQAEPMEYFHFDLFNDQKYDKAAKDKVDADAICAVLYPNDTTDAGKKLRLKQQYFFSSATLQDIVRTYKQKYGDDFSHFSSEYAVQLNDTHPTVAIPEFIRLMMEKEGMTFAKAFKLARETFAYTNHTIMAEALEKWGVNLFKAVIPNVYKYIVMLQMALVKELVMLKVEKENQQQYFIIDGERIHMARMAIFASHSTNGVAQIHTEIFKNDALKEWYAL